MNENKVRFRPLHPPEFPIPEGAERQAAIDAVNRTFLDQTRSALITVNCTALEFLAANPGISLVNLAQLLARQSQRKPSVVGLVVAIYEEAARRKATRETAKDLLVREIQAEFPEGWLSKESVHPLVRIGSWDRHARNYGRDPTVREHAQRIIVDLAKDHPPPNG